MNDMIDMSRFTEAKSDQLNADDLIGAPRTVTVTRVVGAEGDQPIAVHYENDGGKPFKPCKTIRRVLLAIWGRYANDYVGRSMTLYRDDGVQFGGLQVGGIRISHMSHIDKETVVVVAKSKGKKAGMKILPLKVEQQQTEDPAAKWARAYMAKVASAPDVERMDEYVASKADRLASLKDANANLHSQCVAAVATKRARFELEDHREGPTDEQRGEGFTEDEDGEA